MSFSLLKLAEREREREKKRIILKHKPGRTNSEKERSRERKKITQQARYEKRRKKRKNEISERGVPVRKKETGDANNEMSKGKRRRNVKRG